LRQRKTTTEGSQHRERDQLSQARVHPRQFHLASCFESALSPPRQQIEIPKFELASDRLDKLGDTYLTAEGLKNLQKQSPTALKGTARTKYLRHGCPVGRLCHIRISVTLEPITSEQATNRQRLLLIPGRASSSEGEATPEGACKSMNHAQKYLAQANRHIAELYVQIAHQRAIIKDALATGQRSAMAESLLDALEGSLRLFEKHRVLILGQLQRHPFE
jgi:hypothetical protein